MALFFCGKTQNLVPNWSFEDTIKCPNNGDEFVGYAANWGGGGAAGTCYFNRNCSLSGTTVGVPHNQLGYQYPLTGNAYAGIYTYFGPTDTYDTTYRNYLQATLTTTLLSGTTYYATFYVSRADTEQFACNDIGIYFSDSTLNYPTYTNVKSYLTPQIENDPIKNPLTDDINWTKVSGKFKAVGGEKYMVIGNFKPGYLSDTVFFPKGSPVEPAAFYYVDDVILSTDSNYADSILAVQEITPRVEDVQVYPNPANTLLTVQLNLATGDYANACMYNSLGQLIECKQLQNGISTILISNLPSGIYYYRITDNMGNMIKADKQMIVH